MTEAIPCTVAILSFNSESTLRTALESVYQFAEVIVSDGGSVDGTVAVVKEYDRTLIYQCDSVRDSAGRLVDYGAARDQIRKAASQPWIMQLDSDEYASEALVADVRRVCEGAEQVAYTLGARYELDGRVIDCAATYPMTFLRLYRSDSASGYEGKMNERVVVSGRVGTLDSYFVIPMPPLRQVLRKWIRYLNLERIEDNTLESTDLRSRIAVNRSSIRWFIGSVRESRGTCNGQRLPFRYEFARIGFYAARYAVSVAVYGRRRLTELSRWR